MGVATLVLFISQKQSPVMNSDHAQVHFMNIINLPLPLYAPHVTLYSLKNVNIYIHHCMVQKNLLVP